MLWEALGTQWFAGEVACKIFKVRDKLGSPLKIIIKNGAEINWVTHWYDAILTQL